MRYKISIDDGRTGDLRVAELLDKWGLSATFFVPVVPCDLKDHELVELSKRHTIGGHTMTHPMDMKRLSDKDLEWELTESKKRLEEIVGKEIDEFCYPRGRYDERVKKAVKKAGYKNARTTKVLRLVEPEDVYEMETSIHFLPSRTEYNGQPLLKLITEGLQLASEQPNGYFHLWLHSDEIIRLNLWQELDLAFGIMKAYATIYPETK